MMNFIPKTNIDFLKNRRVFFAITAVIILACIACVIVKGFNFGIDFSGGTMVQIKLNQPASIDQVRGALADVNPEVQSFTDRNAFAIKIKGSQDDVNTIKDKVSADLKAAGLDFIVEQTDYVGPTVGKDLSKRAIFALFFSLVFMIIYIAFRFSNITWGASAVIALFHDVILIIGVFAFIRAEVDLIVVAAILTAVGYSINDNIVIFDRMRENMRNNPKMSLYELVNVSINETLSRTVITGGTVFIAVVILYFFGGAVLQSFSLIMIMGVVFGTYSTVFIATPLVYEWAKDSDGAALRAEAKSDAKGDTVKKTKKYRR